MTLNKAKRAFDASCRRLEQAKDENERCALDLISVWVTDLVSSGSLPSDRRHAIKGKQLARLRKALRVLPTDHDGLEARLNGLREVLDVPDGLQFGVYHMPGTQYDPE